MVGVASITYSMPPYFSSSARSLFGFCSIAEVGFGRATNVLCGCPRLCIPSNISYAYLNQKLEWNQNLRSCVFSRRCVLPYSFKHRSTPTLENSWGKIRNNFDIGWPHFFTVESKVTCRNIYSTVCIVTLVKTCSLIALGWSGVKFYKAMKRCRHSLQASSLCTYTLASPFCIRACVKLRCFVPAFSEAWLTRGSISLSPMVFWISLSTVEGWHPFVTIISGHQYEVTFSEKNPHPIFTILNFQHQAFKLEIRTQRKHMVLKNTFKYN